MGIGRRIKEARENLGITQEELGQRVGVTGSAITNYEKENSHPREPVLYALIEVLGVDANFLFQDCVKIKTAPSEDEAILELYRQLNREGQEKVISYAADLVDTGKYKKNFADRLGA